MFEKLFTIKMSGYKKKLQSRFHKFGFKNSNISKVILSLIIVIIALTAVYAVIIATGNRDNTDYIMTKEDLTKFVNQPVGAIMADIDYADEEKVIFHYPGGIFVYGLESREIEKSFDLTKFNCAPIGQGSFNLRIFMSSDGSEIRLVNLGTEEISMFDNYAIDTKSWKVKKVKHFDNDIMPVGLASWPASFGRCSSNTVSVGNKTYYLNLNGTLLSSLRLVIAYSDNTVEYRNIFGD